MRDIRCEAGRSFVPDKLEGRVRGISPEPDKRGERKLELLARLLRSVPDRRPSFSCIDAMAALLRALLERLSRRLVIEGIRGTGGTTELRPDWGERIISPPLILLSRQ